VLKDLLSSSQAWCFEGPIYDGQRDEVSDRTEDQVIYLSEEENRAIIVFQFRYLGGGVGLSTHSFGRLFAPL